MSTDDSSSLSQETLEFFCRHIVAFGWYEGEKGQDGKFKEKPVFYGSSGFILEVDDCWWLVTAGHIFAYHEKRKSKKPITTLDPSIYDFWGPSEQPNHPLPFDFFDPDVERLVYYCPDEGLDYALVKFPDLIGMALSQTIEPFRQVDWKRQAHVDYDFHAIIGLPLEFAEQTYGGDGTPWVRTDLAPALIFLDEITCEEGKVDETRFPQFIGKLNPKFALNDITGMSGGPIIGFRKDNDGSLRYFPIAVQSRWKKQSRVIIGCPIAVVGTLSESIFAKSREDIEKESNG